MCDTLFEYNGNNLSNIVFSFLLETQCAYSEGGTSLTTTDV